MAVDREKVAQAAQKLVEKKRYDKAVEEYQKILAEDPRDVRTLLKVGDLRLKAQQYPDAITTYETVGQFYLQQKQLPKALAVYKQIREIIKKYVPHLEDRFGHVAPKLAEIYAALGYMGDALATYDELAARLSAAGRDRDVIDVFRKVTEIDPSNPLPLLRLADAYMRVRDVDSAIQRLGAAAQSLLKLGRREEALKVLERLLQHRQDPQFCRLAAEIYLDRAGPSDGMAALTKLQVAFKENPRDLETLGLLARAFDTLGQAPKAVEVLKEAARIAKEAGKVDAFGALVDTLQQRAPKDDGVRALVALRTAGSHASRPPSQSIVPTAPIPSPAAPAVRKLSPAQETRINAVDPRASIDIEIEEDEEAEAEPISLSVDAVVESAPRPPPPAALHDPAVRARHLLAQAEQLQRDGNLAEAIALLEGGVESLPDARELRQKLYELLLDADDQPRAIQHMVAFARYLAVANDIDAAVRVLDEVLLFEANQPDAIALLAELGYAVQGLEQAAGDGYDPNAPLPAYELDEVGGPTHGSVATPIGDLDDPFAGDNLPLPSFPIEEEAAPRYSAPPPAAYDPSQYPGYGTGSYAPVQSGGYPVAPAPQAYGAVPVQSGGFPAVRVPPPPPQFAQEGSVELAPPSTGNVEEALDEVDFFVSQGMLDDARLLLEEQLARLPNHPLLLERRRELDQIAPPIPNESGTRVAPRSMHPVQPEEDRAFEFAEALDRLDQIDTHADALDPSQVSVEDVFNQFKEGVKAQVSESDASTHYDLGVAYKEMGLFTDAIAEFEIASRDPARECVCQSMIGMLHMQLGNLEAGIDALIRSLHAPEKTREQELAIMYEIASSYESGQSTAQALQYFQRLARLDPKYYDPRGTVADRVRRLEAPKVPTARAVGQDLVADDFDAAFDELLGGKLP